MQASSRLIGRLSGLAAILSGVLWALGIPGLDEVIPGVSHEGGHLLLAVAGLCSLIGLAGLSSHHAGRYSLAGMAGAVLASLGAVLIFAGNLLEGGFLLELGWGLFMLGMLLLVVGSLLFGIVAMSTSTGRFFGAPLLAIGALGVLMFPFAETAYLGTVVLPILIGVAWTVLGYALWSHRGETIRRPARE